MEHCTEPATTKATKKHLETRNARGDTGRNGAGAVTAQPERCWAELLGADPALPVEVMLASGPGTISDQWTGVRKVSDLALNETGFWIKSSSL